MNSTPRYILMRECRSPVAQLAGLLEFARVLEACHDPSA
jgi:hypothetical protein